MESESEYANLLVILLLTSSYHSFFMFLYLCSKLKTISYLVYRSIGRWCNIFPYLPSFLPPLIILTSTLLTLLSFIYLSFCHSRPSCFPLPTFNLILLSSSLFPLSPLPLPVHSSIIQPSSPLSTLLIILRLILINIQVLRGVNVTTGSSRKFGRAFCTCVARIFNITSAGVRISAVKPASTRRYLSSSDSLSSGSTF